MTAHIVVGIFIATLLLAVPVAAQSSAEQPPLSARFVDPTNGLSLEQAIARALEQEPSLRASRSQIDVAQGTRVQASLRPNPSVSFEQRTEPGGTDKQTTVGVDWPLDLFRRRSRIDVADRELAATQMAIADRERLLAADVRARYGDVLAHIRDLALLDELVAATLKQYDLLRSRVDEGASPPLERDLVDVELRRAQAERLLQAGRTDAAMIELKRLLGLRADAAVAVRGTLEDLVQQDAVITSSVNASTAVEQRPDVREAAARIDVAEANIGRAEAGGRVDVSLFASYMRMDAGFPQRAFAPDGGLERVRGQFNYVSAGAMLTIPLLNRNQGHVAGARAERTGAAAAFEAARLTAESELASAQVRNERALEAVKLYTVGVQPLARQNLNVVTQSYELGRVTVFEVLAERRRYVEVERAYTDALRAAYEARTSLKRALGEVR